MAFYEEKLLDQGLVATRRYPTLGENREWEEITEYEWVGEEEWARPLRTMPRLEATWRHPKQNVVLLLDLRGAIGKAYQDVLVNVRALPKDRQWP